MAFTPPTTAFLITDRIGCFGRNSDSECSYGDSLPLARNSPSRPGSGERRGYPAMHKSLTQGRGLANPSPFGAPFGMVAAFGNFALDKIPIVADISKGTERSIRLITKSIKYQGSQ